MNNERTWDQLTPEERVSLGYPDGIEGKLKKERSNWDRPKVERADEYISHIDFTGERSPYWDWVSKKAPINSDGEPDELSIANPDSVSDEDPSGFAYLADDLDKTIGVSEANRLAKLYLTKSELKLWNYVVAHPYETWSKISEDLKFGERYTLKLLARIRKKLSDHFKT
jgi:hypothetical protein